jgi:hypothetical protein
MATVLLITFAVCDSNQTTLFVESEAKLSDLTMWETRKEIEKRFGVKFARSCDPEGEACSAFPILACIKTDDFYLLLRSDLTSSFNEINGIVFRSDMPTMSCVNKEIRKAKTTILGKNKQEIIALLGKPKYKMPCFAEKDGEYIHSSLNKKHLSSICFRYETDDWKQWSERYNTNIIRYDIVEIEFKNDRVVSYSVYKGAEL